MMRFAVSVPNFGDYGDVGLLVELAADAEAAGWDALFLWDHIAWPVAANFVDPWLALTAIAVRTERLQFGPLVTPLPRRRPWKVARETVTLDHLSAGRLILGVGSGIHREEFDQLGEESDLKTRAAMLDEGLAVLSGLWTGEPFTFCGEHYTVDGAHVPQSGSPAPGRGKNRSGARLVGMATCRIELARPRLPPVMCGPWSRLLPRSGAVWTGSISFSAATREARTAPGAWQPSPPSPRRARHGGTRRSIPG